MSEASRFIAVFNSHCCFISDPADEKISSRPWSNVQSESPADNLPLRWFVGLQPQQKLYVVGCSIILVLLVPKIVVLGFVGVERLLVGIIIAIEEALLATFQRLAGVLAGLAAVGILGTGVYVFFLGNYKRK
jgi:hypothetical protein